jgi:carboxyl-terminal processing protease
VGRNLAALTLAVVLAPPALAQGRLGHDRELGKVMLRAIKRDVQKLYFDPTFGGIDFDARVAQAEEKLAAAQSAGQVMAIVAQALLDLGDSHTRFYPPELNVRAEYGWTMRAVGDTCRVLAVRPGSDAEKKGLRPGDAVLSVNGFPATRATVSTLRYLFYSLRPLPGLRVVAQTPGQPERTLDLAADVRRREVHVDQTEGQVGFWEAVRDSQEERHLGRHLYESLTDEVLLWHMPGFDLRQSDLRGLIGKARKHGTRVLDMRGNPGGLVEQLQELTGALFDRDVTIATERGRKGSKPLVAKKAKEPFLGKLVVLVDADSASSAEILARVVQLERRGVVIGDRTAGAVLVAEERSYELTGTDTVITYGAAIAVSDVVMADGESLEGEGVTPDEVLLPSPEDLAAGRDPVLTRAVRHAGLEIEEGETLRALAYEWPTR